MIGISGWRLGCSPYPDFAMRHTGRIGKPFAFGATASVSEMRGDPEKTTIFPQIITPDFY
jgi:hypothetical protein